MLRIVSAAAVASLMLLAACGTAPKSADSTAASGTSSAQVAAPAPTVLPIQPVRIPAASVRKLVLNMTGPKTVTEAKDWSSFKEEWRATFADHAKQQGIAFAMQEGDARSLGEPGTLLNVTVNDYRQVGIGARIFFGVMTGNAFIDAKIGFLDLNGGERFGEQSFNTTSSAWSGVFAKMTPQQVDAIATEVFASLKPR